MGIVELLSKVLAQQDSWSRAFVEGYAAGQALRLQNETLPSYAMVEVDEWVLGFRSAYFGRQSRTSSQFRIASISETAQKCLDIQAV